MKKTSVTFWLPDISNNTFFSCLWLSVHALFHCQTGAHRIGLIILKFGPANYLSQNPHKIIMC